MTTSTSSMDSPSSAASSSTKKMPSTIITMGMAGAGKSTFVQRSSFHGYSLLHLSERRDLDFFQSA
ncbi:hypothetical protein K443DRAFT_11259 [Laccaria amethystina LaAM-08-1]|uniref:Uncharacterized protein n=1 Tax=Laccaria amethystina LaAM-08-1 TaxID=1095629 RepID=A0A0C9XD22_9AGAR|nr:hypothetical protein K443DRAFT_11259 [Laccaria amethystina LaAM-08-1]